MLVKHLTFNQKTMGSIPIGVTKLPPWRNGSVFVLHAKGDSSILSGGTNSYF